MSTNKKCSPAEWAALGVKFLKPGSAPLLRGVDYAGPQVGEPRSEAAEATGIKTGFEVNPRYVATTL